MVQEFDDLLWSLVRRHISTNDLDGELNRTADDLFSIAQEAAMIAIAKYRSNKNTKLSTWITANVKFALRKRNLSNQETFEFPDNWMPEESYTIEEIEFNLAMKQLLSPLLYRIYHMRFVEDKGEMEIADALGYSRHKVRECLSLILQKYKLIEKSQYEVLTTRRRQDNWLSNSEESLNE